MFDCCILSISCSPCSRTVAIQICQQRKNNCCLFIHISLVVDSGNINCRSRSFIVSFCQCSGDGVTETNVSNNNDIGAGFCALFLMMTTHILLFQLFFLPLDPLTL
jgi:hypothetical protein